MRTAILSVIFAVMAAGAPQQDPARADSQPAQRLEKPAEAPLSVLCAPRTTIQPGVAYDSAVLASGGTGAYRFAVIGGALPPGVKLNPTSGTIFGTPTADGAFSYTVQVTDSAGAMATTGNTPCALQLPDVTAPVLSPIELGNVVKERLKKYLVDPDVSVSVNAVNSKRYYIQGEVNKTGAFPLLVPTKVLEALVNAGGFRDFANQKKIVVMRMTGERLNFNYKEVIRGKKMEQNIYLKPGDIIIVK